MLDKAGNKISVHNGWIKAVHYPDPTTGQPSELPSLKFQYYSDGSVASREDEKGNKFVYHYDEQGRLEQTDVTGSRWYAAGANQRYSPPPQIIKITYTYTSDGLSELVTAYGDGEVILSQNKFEYDGLRHLHKEWQSHGGAVTGSTPAITYDWDASPKDASSSGYDRLVGMTYPTRPEAGGGARSLSYSYVSDTGDVDSRLNRITRILEDSTALVRYDYMGTSRRVKTTLGNGVVQSFLDGSNNAIGLDRFGRVQDLHFKNGTNTVHHYEYGYDKAGNRTYARVTQATIGGTAHDDDRSYLYGYDQLQRLILAHMGRLATDNQSILPNEPDVTLRRKLEWYPDSLGNWSGLDEVTVTDKGLRRTDKTPGNDPTVTQIRHEVDAFNKITGVNTDGQTVAHVNDSAGNLVFDGTYVYQYDAWNRLVEVNEAGTLTTADFTSDGKINVSA